MSELNCQAVAYIENAKTTNTMRAYSADWQDFAAYCVEAGADVLVAGSSVFHAADRTEAVRLLRGEA